jgi:hypothetical protein
VLITYDPATDTCSAPTPPEPPEPPAPVVLAPRFTG